MDAKTNWTKGPMNSLAKRFEHNEDQDTKKQQGNCAVPNHAFTPPQLDPSCEKRRGPGIDSQIQNPHKSYQQQLCVQPVLMQILGIFTDQEDSRNHHQRRAGMSQTAQKPHL